MKFPKGNCQPILPRQKYYCLNKNRERIIKLLNIFWSLQRGGWGRDAGGEKKRGERHEAFSLPSAPYSVSLINNIKIVSRPQFWERHHIAIPEVYKFSARASPSLSFIRNFFSKRV